MASGGVRSSSQLDEHTGTSSAEIAPLYERLPRGQHQMEPGQVAENQRRRIYGAMVQAVAANGYGPTSVKRVVTLAGVSRRAFYEQFANKQECFLATFQLIAKRAMSLIAATYRSTEGTLEQRLRATLTTFAMVVKHNPKDLRLMLVDAPSAGPAGWEQLTQTLMVFEERLAASFADAPDAAPLPEPVARAIVGGLRRATFVRLLEGRTDEMPALVGHMLSWTLMFKTAAPSPLGARLREVSVDVRLGREDDRARILRSALELAAQEGHDNLTPMRIADEAGVSIDTFFDLFDDMEVCFLAAIEKLGEEVREIVSDPGLTSADWPAAVRRALDDLLRYFAARPAYAQTIATGVFASGQHTVDVGAELAREVAAKLTAGAPASPKTGLAQEGIEGAIWHTIYCQSTNGGTGALPELSEYLAYVVLAPFIGADAAAELVTQDDRHLPQSAAGPRCAYIVSGALAALSPAALGEVREHDAHEQRDHDHDDQRRLAGAKDIAHLHLFQVEDGEQRDQDRQHDERTGTRQLAPATALAEPLTDFRGLRGRSHSLILPSETLSATQLGSTGSRSIDPPPRAQRLR
jgi:AcrR family transcriptional regulator